MTSDTKEFEISIRHSVYWGTYYFEGNELHIGECYTQDIHENEIECDFKTVSDIVYPALEKEKSDEVNEWMNNYDDELQESIKEDIADEKRKYF